MTDKEQWIAEQSTYQPVRSLGLVHLLKRVPNSLRWRLIKAYWKIEREATGLVHHLRGRKVLHFFHIGKAGGTAIKAALAGYEHAGEYKIVLQDHWHHFYTLEEVPWLEKVAFVVRDPVQRFVSGFLGRQRQDRPRYEGLWSPEEAAVFSQFHSPNQLALALSSDDVDLRVAAAAAIKSVHQLQTPQWMWFNSLEYFQKNRSRILFIGFLETLDEDFALFKRILNLPADLELPHDEVAAHRSSPHVDKRLDDEAIRNLKIWYRQDYEFIDLCREISAEIRARYESTPSLPTDLAQTDRGRGTSKSSGTALL